MYYIGIVCYFLLSYFAEGQQKNRRERNITTTDSQAEKWGKRGRFHYLPCNQWLNVITFLIKFAKAIIILTWFDYEWLLLIISITILALTVK